MPRDGVCADDVGLSVLKFFISCATRPRPAQVGAPPADPGSCGGVTGEESEAAASGKKTQKNKNVMGFMYELQHRGRSLSDRYHWFLPRFDSSYSRPVCLFYCCNR